MIAVTIIPGEEIGRLRAAASDARLRARITVECCRLNTLSAVKRAGSGHLGSSLSALDINVWLYGERLNSLRAGLDSPERDIFFSSKGHDVPGQYAVLHAFGVLPQEKLLSLRRLGGLDGHPDVAIRGIEANTGSLGMGISKAKGMALAKRLGRRGGRVYVLTGDGEWQEGQNFEALQGAAQLGLDNLVVIVDHNKVQTDRPVSTVVSGDFQAKLTGFGWHIERCDGHDVTSLDRALDACLRAGSPALIIADTIKGRGVSFMEHPAALAAHDGHYPWHSGAPGDADYGRARDEILARLAALLAGAGLAPARPLVVEPETAAPSGVSDEYVADGYGQELLRLGRQRPDLVVLDADLAADCRVRDFAAAFPERFIENGIAEQDMVSTAGGLALQGFLPVVNSFGVFLASRANEQIYNNATEKTRIIYVCHYAGLIPAGPGKSHQSLRDISLFEALPGEVTALQPCNAEEAAEALRYCVSRAPGPCLLRLNIGPSPRRIAPSSDPFLPGRGRILRPGDGDVLLGYGPVLLHEALLAAEELERAGRPLAVWNMPWLNRVDGDWLAEVVAGARRVFVLDDHAPRGGLGDSVLEAMNARGLLDGRRVVKFAVRGHPACGRPKEALAAHGLDGASLARRITQAGG